MRIFLFVISLAFTVFLCVLLNSKWLLPAPLGKLLSPQHGIWQNADDAIEGVHELQLDGLKGKVTVSFNNRLVPHIIAENETDAYFVQGYLHAKYRLWQMELQTLAAAGRASEVAGQAAVDHDREFRRLGMVYAAENSLKVLEADPVIKAACDAYSAGVNSYIESLSESELPVEYKLIGYFPERWSNLKTALFMKYMSYDLAARENDFEMTNARAWFTPQQLELLFPVFPDSLDPIISRGTVYGQPGINPVQPVITADSLLNVEPASKPAEGNGSNNWVVGGSKTADGSPILCNDPHLGLNLPSIWYEMQITVPEFNTYGVSFPGAPSIVIGFNDSIAWGVTNGGRDVRDYYDITFRDENMNEYLYNGEWIRAEKRIEKIRVRDGNDILDTVTYTVFGPVMYDPSFNERSGKGYYAVKWAAHEGSNELKVFNLLNRAQNYQDYLAALKYMSTPGQNFAFAARSGDIAMRTQGRFPAKWKGQGDVVMPGKDTSYLWQGTIPEEETPYQYNPERGFVSSANQHPADDKYPYYLGWDYPVSRGIIVNRMLSRMNDITVDDMKAMQTDNYNVFAEMALDKLLPLVDSVPGDRGSYYSILKEWNRRNDPNEKGATIFDVVWEKFYVLIYSDEYEGAPKVIAKPSPESLLFGILRDSVYIFTDDRTTTELETEEEMFVRALLMAQPTLDSLAAADKLDWGKYRGTRINHLARIEPFNREVITGGGKHIINATTSNHGPSWRMIVRMGPEIEAWGIYPGGQSGNPGSRFYDNFINDWAEGRYYRLDFKKRDEAAGSKPQMIFTPKQKS